MSYALLNRFDGVDVVIGIDGHRYAGKLHMSSHAGTPACSIERDTQVTYFTWDAVTHIVEGQDGHGVFGNDIL